MSAWNLLSGLVEPVAKLIDDIHTSDEERLVIKSELFKMQSTLVSQVLDYEAKIVEAKSSIIVAEAQGQSGLQRNWRPITMLTFLVLVVADVFGVTTFRLSGEAWLLLQLGLGGYVVGRSAEKIVPQVTQVMKKG